MRAITTPPVTAGTLSRHSSAANRRVVSFHVAGDLGRAEALAALGKAR